MWHVTCDMWHVTNNNFFTHHVAYFWIPYNLRSSQEYTICNKWQVTCDTWHVTCDMWHVTCDMWHVTSKHLFTHHVAYFRIPYGPRSSQEYTICNMWHVTCDMWHVTKNNCFTHHVAYFWIHYNPRSSQEYTTCDSWQPVDVLSSPVIFSLDSLKGLESIE